MNVKDVMTKEVKSCKAHDMLSEAARLMWDHDCGCVPVVDAKNDVVGMITDRDICMAAATKGRPLRHIAVREVVSGHLHACFPTDDVETALATMSSARVRRLPVVDQEARLKGVVSLNDFILAADAERGRISGKNVLGALRAVSEHRSLVAVS